jgi:hypothetical protein
MAVYGGLAAISALFYRDSLGLPAGVYDPLGAGTLPRIITAGIILFSAIALVQSWYRSRKRPSAAAATPPENLRPDLAAVIFGFAVVFGVLIAYRVPFWISTFLFLLASSLSITGLGRPAIVRAVIFAAVMAAGVTFLFGSVFRVDLP